MSILIVEKTLMLHLPFETIKFQVTFVYLINVHKEEKKKKKKSKCYMSGIFTAEIILLCRENSNLQIRFDQIDSCDLVRPGRRKKHLLQIRSLCEKS